MSVWVWCSLVSVGLKGVEEEVIISSGGILRKRRKEIIRCPSILGPASERENLDGI